jgi:hypothetical protein
MSRSFGDRQPAHKRTQMVRGCFFMFSVVNRTSGFSDCAAKQIARQGQIRTITHMLALGGAIGNQNFDYSAGSSVQKHNDCENASVSS